MATSTVVVDASLLCRLGIFTLVRGHALAGSASRA